MEIGGARGIGLTLSKACLEAGAVVVVTDILRPDDGFTETQNQAAGHLFYYQYALVNRRRKRAASLIGSSCDLTKEEEFNQTFDQIFHRFHDVDGM